MKIPCERRFCWCAGAGWFLTLGLFAALQLAAQLGRFGILRGFKFPDFYDTSPTGKGQTNRLKGMLMGAVAQYITNDTWRLTQMRLEHFQFDGQTNLVAQAPQCLFDEETRVAWSTGRLEIVGLHGALFVEGNEGFEARMTNSTLTISNRVRTVLRQEQGPVKASKP